MPRKEVLVQLNDELVSRLDGIAERRATSRSALVRDAVEKYVVQALNEEKDRQWREGYERIPDTGEFDEWAEESLREMLEEESW